MKLNKSNVDAIPLTEKGQKFYRDSELIGFGVRATTKSKTYIIERRHEGELFRVVIGKTTEITANGARARAQMILAQITNGEYVKDKKINDYGQLLHASYLGFEHPITKKYLEFNAPLEKEFLDILEKFRNS